MSVQMDMRMRALSSQSALVLRDSGSSWRAFFCDEGPLQSQMSRGRKGEGGDSGAVSVGDGHEEVVFYVGPLAKNLLLVRPLCNCQRALSRFKLT